MPWGGPGVVRPRFVRQAVRRQPNREQFRFALALILEQEGKLPDAAKELPAPFLSCQS